jgi:hypothetical protein
MSKAVVTMTSADAEHFTPEQKARIIERTPEHERDARRVIGFWLRFSDQISKARAVADFAQKDGLRGKDAGRPGSPTDHNARPQLRSLSGTRGDGVRVQGSDART